jgi:hypothetical protein
VNIVRNRLARSGLVLFLFIYLIAVALVSVPMPGMIAKVIAAPTDYPVPDKQGKIMAPNVSDRSAFIVDWIGGITVETAKLQTETPSATDDDSASSAIDGLLGGTDELSEYYDLPYDIPAAFYAEFAEKEADPHEAMKALAQWNAQSEEDVTQGKTIMGIGDLSADGSIAPVDHMEAYTLAAQDAKPDVFFVPTSSYPELKDLAPDLLLVPVGSFEEVLYFLSQPPEFWYLRNFGLFCH